MVIVSEYDICYAETVHITGLKSKHYFSFFFSELKGPLGSAGEAKLQNETAVLVSLSMFSRLARLAREADPGNFRHPSSTVSRVYGLRTGQGGRVWTIVVGVADLMASRRPLIEPTEADPRELNDDTDHDSEKVVS